MASLNELGVYKLVPRSSVPPGQKVINSRRVLKRKADNSFKARVVAQGWNQVPSLDCGNTFASGLPFLTDKSEKWERSLK